MPLLLVVQHLPEVAHVHRLLAVLAHVEVVGFAGGGRMPDENTV